MPQRAKKIRRPARKLDDLSARSAEQRSADHQLIKDALAGNQKAFERLRKKYENIIVSLVNRMIHNKDEVDDLVQETFIKAFQSLPSFRAEYAFSTWLYRIASNNCIDYLRKKKLQTLSIDKQVESEESDYSIELPDTSMVPDRQMMDAQRREMINKAIESLPQKYRDVIRLRHMEELEYDEIAKKLRIPLGTVKAHLFRARELLYRYMRDRLRHY